MVLSEDDIHIMPDTELIDCAEFFGKMNLDNKLQYAIWKRIHKVIKFIDTLNSFDYNIQESDHL